MDKLQAREIIKNTFENSFDKQRFKKFILDFLNHFEENTFVHKGYNIPHSYNEYISSWQRLGKYSDGENRIDILIVNLKKETSLEQARSRQRNFVAGYLQGKYGRSSEKEAALVAYVSPNKTDWRFSLVKMDYKFEKTKSGGMKAKEEFTPARRWSFLVGKNEKSHTAQSRLVNILTNDEKAPTLEEIEKAFDIETVTKEFFLKYRELFLRTKEELDRVVENDLRVKADFETNNVDTVNFAKKLLGQIVFLYFLQKKGWFGVGRDDDWGTGSKHFLRELFKKKHGNYNNFFNDILEPLFYEALRRDRSDDDGYYSRFNCKIPFLNGGLFDPIGNYDWVHTDIIIPDKLFSNTKETREGDTGDGILDIFDRYNFTVKEDEPLEKEVAIDPELLGKAYEKFNAIRPDNFEEFKEALKSGKKGEENKFNKKFGVYYTPREIVHYMCQQSLINYLHTELVGAECLPPVKKEDIETIIQLGEHVSENDMTALIKEQKIAEGKQKTTKNKPILSESIRENAEMIDEKLADITVCDPAVGSGAFPVGMMSEIVKARNILTTYMHEDNTTDGFTTDGFSHQPNTRTPYNFKRRCIEHSLYGVDIDPGAVEIAKLRLWLSLIVDETPNNSRLKPAVVPGPAVAPKPLPNLDYKILCGNSLLGVEKNLFNNELFKELEKLKPLFFNETNPKKKQDYKNKIEELIYRITNGHTEFDFEVYFSEVFQKKTIEKNWKAYHITWVTHGSRVSERMVEFGVKTPDAVELDDKSRKIIAEALAKKIKEQSYRILAVNVLQDHTHCIVVCEEHDLSRIVHDLKGTSSFEHNRLLQLSVEGGGRQIKLWAKGSSQTLLESEHYILNAVEYVENNHLKHDLSEIASSAHNQQLKQSVVGLDQAFAPVIEKGGFDVVIANPPYVKEYVNRKVFDGLRNLPCYQGKMDIWYLFACKGIDIAKKYSGLVTYIAQNNWVTSHGASKMRNKVIKEVQILSLIDFGDYKIFEAGIQTMVMLFKADSRLDNYKLDYRRLNGKGLEFKDVINLLNKKQNTSAEYMTPTIRRCQLVEKTITFSNADIQKILKKMSSMGGLQLDHREEVAQGIVCPQDNVNKASKKVMGEKFKVGYGIFTLSDDELRALRLSIKEMALIKPFYTTNELQGWWTNSKNQRWIIYTDSSFKNKKKMEKYPSIKKHLDQFKKVITSDNKPYGLHRARNEHFFQGEKIIAMRKCKRPTFSYVDFDSYVSATFYVIKTERVDQKYLTAVLNSKLLAFWLRHKGKMQGSNYQIDKEPLLALPLLKPSQADQNKMADIVDKILSITKVEDYLQNPQKQAKVKALEREIDQIVYKLYGLTEEEIKIVERANKK